MLPATLEAGRFYVHPVTKDGGTLDLLTDTGGGLLIVASAAERVGLEVQKMREGRVMHLAAALPEFRADASIPPISLDDDPRSLQYHGLVSVMPDDEFPFDADGLLGQVWFGGRTWTFDYPNERFEVGTTLVEGPHTVPIGFPTDSGRRLAHFPSIDATIDGETYAFLFDTGATVAMSRRAHAEIADDAPAVRATSFAAASLFDGWREDHPEWRVIERADTNVRDEPMIEVPTVGVAGHEAGPVWFTRRADRNFHDWMSSMMDRRVDGALGGSLLRYFKVTVDYPHALATFDRA